jgi:hypothetical protein
MVVARAKDKALIGAAGVFNVSAELMMRGIIALPTIRNTPDTTSSPQPRMGLVTQTSR